MGRIAATGLAALTMLAATGCEDFDDSPSTRIGNTDAAGRAQQVPAADRVDVGGEEQLQPLALAATGDVAAEHRGKQVTWEASFYGRSTWGMCLGSSEAAVLSTRAGWGIETCEKSGIRILSLPIAHGAWLAVGNRAAMRPEVFDYVLSTIERAPDAAADAGVEPLGAAALAATRSRFEAFAAAERADGVVPMVG